MAAHVSADHPGEGLWAGFATSFTSAGLVGMPMPSFPKAAQDGEIEVAAGDDRVLHVGHEATQLDVECEHAKAHEKHVGAGVRMTCGCACAISSNISRTRSMSLS